MIYEPIYLAFYKKRREVTDFKSFIYRACDDITKIVTRGRYSHCEIAIAKGLDYDCYTSSVRDGGVRKKRMGLDQNDWDLVDISHLINENQIKSFYYDTTGMKYDFLGLMSTVVGNVHEKNKYFCSEWCAEALGIHKSNKVSPAGLYIIVKRLLKYR